MAYNPDSFGVYPLLCLDAADHRQNVIIRNTAMYEKSPAQHNGMHPAHLKQSIEGAAIQVEDDRTGTTVETPQRALADNLYYTQGEG